MLTLYINLIIICYTYVIIAYRVSTVFRNLPRSPASQTAQRLQAGSQVGFDLGDNFRSESGWTSVTLKLHAPGERFEDVSGKSARACSYVEACTDVVVEHVGWTKFARPVYLLD